MTAVDYRRLPEHKHPKSLNDAFAAFEWMVKTFWPETAGTSKLFIVGDSAGASVATISSLRAKTAGHPITGQILICPFTAHWTSGHESLNRFARRGSLTLDSLKWFWDMYLPSGTDYQRPDVSPLRVTELRFLPKTLILAAECGPLRDDSILIAKRMREEGVATRLIIYSGIIHNFILFFNQVNKEKMAFTEIADFVAPQ